MTPSLNKTTLPLRPLVLQPADRERQADLLDRHLAMDPVDGVDRSDLVARVRRGEAHPVEDAARGADEHFAARRAKAARCQKLGTPFLVVAAASPVAGLIGGAVFAGMRWGWLAGIGGAVAGAIGTALVGFGLGTIGDKIYSRVKPPTEHEVDALNRLRRVGERLEAGPARTEAEQAAARAAADAARKTGHPVPVDLAPGDRPDTEHINGALFGAGDLSVRSAFAIPSGMDLASTTGPQGRLVGVQGRSRLVALDSTSGHEVWARDLQGSDSWQTPVMSASGLLALGGRGSLKLFDGKTGEELAAWSSGDQYLHASFDRKGRLLVSGWDGGRTALLDPTRPDPLWVADTSSRAHVVPGPEGMVYEVEGETPFKARSSSDGKERWVAVVDGNLMGEPAVAPDGTLVAPDGYDRITAYEPDYGLRLWSTKTSTYRREPVGTVDGTKVLLPMDGDRLAALDVGDGKQQWSTRLEGGLSAGPVVAPDGTILVADNNGGVYLLDPDRGIATRKAKLESPATRLVALPEGEVLAVDRSNKAHRLSAKVEPQQDPGRIESEEEFVIIGGVKVPVKK